MDGVDVDPDARVITKAGVVPPVLHVIHREHGRADDARRQRVHRAGRPLLPAVARRPAGGRERERPEVGGGGVIARKGGVDIAEIPKQTGGHAGAVWTLPEHELDATARELGKLAQPQRHLWNEAAEPQETLALQGAAGVVLEQRDQVVAVQLISLHVGCADLPSVFDVIERPGDGGVLDEELPRWSVETGGCEGRQAGRKDQQGWCEGPQHVAP